VIPLRSWVPDTTDDAPQRCLGIRGNGRQEHPRVLTDPLSTTFDSFQPGLLLPSQCRYGLNQLDQRIFHTHRPTGRGQNDNDTVVVEGRGIRVAVAQEDVEPTDKRRQDDGADEERTIMYRSHVVYTAPSKIKFPFWGEPVVLCGLGLISVIFDIGGPSSRFSVSRSFARGAWRCAVVGRRGKDEVKRSRSQANRASWERKGLIIPCEEKRTPPPP